MSTSKCWWVRWPSGPAVDSIIPASIGEHFECLVACVDSISDVLYFVVVFSRVMKESTLRLCFDGSCMFACRPMGNSFKTALSYVARHSLFATNKVYKISSIGGLSGYSIGQSTVKPVEGSIDYYILEFSRIQDNKRKAAAISKDCKRVKNLLSVDTYITPDVWFFHYSSFHTILNFARKTYGERLFVLDQDGLQDWNPGKFICIFQLNQDTHILYKDIYDLIEKGHWLVSDQEGNPLRFNFATVVIYSSISHSKLLSLSTEEKPYDRLHMDHVVDWTGILSKDDKGSYYKIV